MPTRRDALRVIAAGAAIPILPVAQTASPGFFTKDELFVLARLVDLIIPRTDTPGAADAGVHLLVDGNEILRAGIASLGGTKFLELSVQDQHAALAKISDSEFFKALKDATIEGYYSTREGLVQELGYQGSVPLASFPGCTHPEHQK